MYWNRRSELSNKSQISVHITNVIVYLSRKLVSQINSPLYGCTVYEQELKIFVAGQQKKYRSLKNNRRKRRMAFSRTIGHRTSCACLCGRATARHAPLPASLPQPPCCHAPLPPCTRLVFGEATRRFSARSCDRSLLLSSYEQSGYHGWAVADNGPLGHLGRGGGKPQRLCLYWAECVHNIRFSVSFPFSAHICVLYTIYI